jgi:hypothetical protein
MEWITSIAAVILLVLAALGHVSWFAPAIAAMVAAFFWWLVYCINHDIDTPWG